MPAVVTVAADKLYDSWNEHWQSLGSDSDRGVVDIDHKINQLRKSVLAHLKRLE